MAFDLRVFRSLIKNAAGSGRPASAYEDAYRRGLRDAEMIALRLSNGWRYENGEWIEPTQAEKAQIILRTAIE